jgi:menaquinone-9 beta-reductase
VSYSRSSTDVFIIGGGPAGLAAAIAARKKGFDVIVADGSAPPIEKPCGEGMMPETLAALKTMGVELNPTQGHKFPGICFVQEGASVCADFPQGPGLGLRRTLLHERMVARAEECGVQFLWKTPVAGIDSEGVHLSHAKIRARWIVGADGLGSRVRRWSGLQSTTRRKQRYATRRRYRVQPWSNHMQIHWGAHAQAYVTPMGADEVCIVVLAEHVKHSSFDAALQEFPELAQSLVGGEVITRERGAVTATRSLYNVHRGNVALIGDASGSVDAITGEGLLLAFRQASALAGAIAANDLRPYQRAHRALARRPTLMGDLMLWLGRHPRVRARLIRALQGKPELFARLLAIHVATPDNAEILSAGATLGWSLLDI